MNQEIQDIIIDMQGRCKTDAIAESDKQTYLMVQSSRLSVLLAKETEIHNKEVSKQTEKIMGLLQFSWWRTGPKPGSASPRSPVRREWAPRE